MGDAALAGLGVVWDDNGAPQGYQIGKAVRLLDSAHRREQRDFERLISRLRAKKYWANKNAESKARIKAYRAQWQRDHREAMNALSRKGKAKLRANKEYRAAELAAKRARWAEVSAKRRAATVYTCHHCGSQWSPAGRIPCRPPKWCSVACRNARRLAERRAAGLCFECDGEAGGKTRCDACTERQRRRKKTARARKRDGATRPDDLRVREWPAEAKRGTS